PGDEAALLEELADSQCHATPCRGFPMRAIGRGRATLERVGAEVAVPGNGRIDAAASRVKLPRMSWSWIERVRPAVPVRLYGGVSRPLTLGLLACTVAGGVLAPAFTIATGALAAAVEAHGPASLPLLAVGLVFTLQRILGP